MKKRVVKLRNEVDMLIAAMKLKQTRARYLQNAKLAEIEAVESATEKPLSAATL